MYVKVKNEVLDLWTYWHERVKLDLQSAGSSPNLTYTKLSAFDAITGLLFDLGACWDKGLDSDSDLDQGLTIVTNRKLEQSEALEKIF